MKTSYTNKRNLYKKIDSLPSGPSWTVETLELKGDVMGKNGHHKKEILHLFRRDPVECIRELMGNPAFKDKIRYAPEKVFEDAEGRNRIFDEAWTGTWWWDMQVSRSLIT